MNPGDYTARMSYFPVNGAHQGIAPQRDFLILSALEADTDLKTTPKFEELMKSAMASIKGQHPLVMSIWKEDGEFAEGLHQHEGHGVDWVWQTKVGAVPVSLILAGQAEQ
jgi:hypothetical protein